MKTYFSILLLISFSILNAGIPKGYTIETIKTPKDVLFHVTGLDTDKDGNSKSGEDYLTVKYDKIVPLLIESIKEQQKQIDELRRELEELK